MSRQKFATFIATRRDELGLSQRQLALKLNVDPSYVGRIESGKQLLSLDMLVLLAQELNIKPGKLVDIFADEEEGQLQDTILLPEDFTALDKQEIEQFINYLAYKKRNPIKEASQS